MLCTEIVIHRCKQIIFTSRYKSNIKLEEGDKYEMRYDQHTGSCILYVKDVAKTDDGTYKCKVDNGLGTSSHQCELCVELKNG